jgi:excisionase family DNA binding protein
MENPFETINNKLIYIEEILLRLESKIDGPIKEPELMNIDDVARLLDLKKSTLYGLVFQRNIPFIKRGKKLYFKRSEILKWLEKDRIYKPAYLRNM